MLVCIIDVNNFQILAFHHKYRIIRSSAWCWPFLMFLPLTSRPLCQRISPSPLKIMNSATSLSLIQSQILSLINLISIFPSLITSTPDRSRQLFFWPLQPPSSCLIIFMISAFCAGSWVFPIASSRLFRAFFLSPSLAATRALLIR
jgi:hypothetical protein